MNDPAVSCGSRTTCIVTVPATIYRHKLSYALERDLNARKLAIPLRTAITPYEWDSSGSPSQADSPASSAL
jgi:hypothetical protein